MMTKIAKEVTMKQGLDMSCDRQDEDIIWQGAVVNVIMYDKLISDADRKKKKLKKAHSRKLNEIA